MLEEFISVFGVKTNVFDDISNARLTSTSFIHTISQNFKQIVVFKYDFEHQEQFNSRPYRMYKDGNYTAELIRFAYGSFIGNEGSQADMRDQLPIRSPSVLGQRQVATH